MTDPVTAGAPGAPAVTVSRWRPDVWLPLATGLVAVPLAVALGLERSSEGLAALPAPLPVAAWFVARHEMRWRPDRLLRGWDDVLTCSARFTAVGSFAYAACTLACLGLVEAIAAPLRDPGPFAERVPAVGVQLLAAPFVAVWAVAFFGAAMLVVFGLPVLLACSIVGEVARRVALRASRRHSGAGTEPVPEGRVPRGRGPEGPLRVVRRLRWVLPLAAAADVLGVVHDGWGWRPVVAAGVLSAGGLASALLWYRDHHR